MDTEELFELGTRLGLSGDDLEQWVLEEQRYWREEKELELELLKKIADMEKARAVIENERDEHVRAREKIEKETLPLKLRLAELEATLTEPRKFKDGGEIFDKVQAFSPPRSSADQRSPPLDVARDANEHRELDVTDTSGGPSIT